MWEGRVHPLQWKAGVCVGHLMTSMQIIYWNVQASVHPLKVHHASSEQRHPRVLYGPMNLLNCVTQEHGTFSGTMKAGEADLPACSSAASLARGFAEAAKRVRRQVESEIKRRTKTTLLPEPPPVHLCMATGSW